MEITNRTEWNTKDFQKLINECIRREGIGNHRRIEIEYARHSWSSYHGRAWVNSNWIKMIVPRPITKEFIDGEYRPTETVFNPETFAKIFIHELGHNRGLQHEEMISWSQIDATWAKDFKVGLKEELKIIKQDKTVIDNKVKEINEQLDKLREKINYWQKEYHEKNNVSPKTNNLWDCYDNMKALNRAKQRILDSELKIVSNKTKPEKNLIQERYQKVCQMVKTKKQLIKRNQTLLKKWERKQKYYKRKLGVQIPTSPFFLERIILLGNVF